MFPFLSAERRHAALMRELLALRAGIITLEKIMADKYDDLRAAVAAEQTVAASAIALINGMADRIEAASNADDKDEIASIVADLRANQSDLAQAVTSNTGLGVVQSAPVSGPLPEAAAVVDAHPANGGTGSGPLNNVSAPVTPTDETKAPAAPEIDASAEQEQRTEG